MVDDGFVVRCAVFGQAVLVSDDGTRRMWCTPVSVLGPTTLVSLTLSGDFPTRPDQVYPVEPAVMLWAAGEDGAWIPCEPVGISGSARPGRAATLHYHFDTPALDPVVAMRLDITYLGATSTHDLGA